MSRYDSSSNTSSDLSKIFWVIFGIIGAVVGFCAFLLYGTWAGALVGSTLWGWFISPVFGLPLLTKAQAWGIGLLLSYWTYHHNPALTDDTRSTTKRVTEIVTLLMYPWATLFFGWVCHRYFIL